MLKIRLFGMAKLNYYQNYDDDEVNQMQRKYVKFTLGARSFDIQN